MVRKQALGLMALIAWGLAGGGGGCNTYAGPVPVQLPLYCKSNVYHWGQIEGSAEDIAYTQVGEDCEWNGLDDAGLGPFGTDDDSLDPTDPRVHWDYFLEGGSYETLNFAWSGGVGVTSAVTWTIGGLGFDVAAGNVVTVRVDGEALCGGYSYKIKCPGTEEAAYSSWSGGAHPVVTAAQSSTCTLEVLSAAVADPSGWWWDCETAQSFSVWRRP